MVIWYDSDEMDVSRGLVVRPSRPEHRAIKEAVLREGRYLREGLMLRPFTRQSYYIWSLIDSEDVEWVTLDLEELTVELLVGLGDTLEYEFGNVGDLFEWVEEFLMENAGRPDKIRREF